MVEFIPVSGDGVVDLDALARMLPGEKALVSVMLANNETGVVQPIREIVALAQAHEALVQPMPSGARQAAGELRTARRGHDDALRPQARGPVGGGALVVRDGLALEPLVHGGGQELRRRAGTENLVAIAGFGAVAQIKMNTVNGLRDRLESSLEDAVIFGATAERLPNTTCFAVPGLDAETLLMSLDLEGVAVSSGSACSSGKVAKSHVLAAMGVAPEISKAAIRVSLGWDTTEHHIDRFIAAWRKILARHKARAAA